MSTPNTMNSSPQSITPNSVQNAASGGQPSILVTPDDGWNLNRQKIWDEHQLRITQNPKAKVPKVITLSQFATLQPPGWVVDGLIPRGGISLLFAPENTGKSFFALDMGLSVARGVLFLGHKVSAGQVLYIAGEGAFGYVNRVAAYQQEKASQGWGNAPFHFIADSINLSTPEGRAELGSVMAQLLPDLPITIIIDTLHACMPGLDENSSKDIGKFTEIALELVRELRVTVLLVHHSKKGENEYRGHSSIAAACDSMIMIEAEPGDRDLRISCRKMKDGAYFADFGATLRTVQLPNGQSSCVIESAPLPKKNLQGSLTQQNVLTALTQPMRHKDWKVACKAHAIESKGFNEALKVLVADGRVVQDGKLYRPAAPPATAKAA